MQTEEQKIEELLKPEEIINELQKRYPSGFIGGRVIGVVRQYGMQIQWVNPDFTKAQVNLKEDDQVSIIFIRGDMLEIASNGQFSKALVSPLFFKKFIVHT